MTTPHIVRALARRGFKYDEAVVHKSNLWFGVIDAVGKTSICGDCHGVPVAGFTRAAMDAEALYWAEHYSTHLQPCTDPACAFHNEED
jgi:hypothetical protein